MSFLIRPSYVHVVVVVVVIVSFFIDINTQNMLLCGHRAADNFLIRIGLISTLDAHLVSILIILSWDSIEQSVYPVGRNIGNDLEKISEKRLEF